MELIDTHAHLLAEYYPAAGEIDAVLARARAAGVTAVLNVGTRLAESKEAVALAERHPDVWATVGVHQHDAGTLTAQVLSDLEALARNPRVVAVGECGLDYHYDHSPREVQREALRLQVRLARAVGKPLVLHNRESDADLLALLEEEGAGEVGGVIHAFSTGEATAAAALALGFHLGFGGMITFKSADLVRRSLRATPPERLLLETDSPYLTPVPHRGRTNEPGHVRLVAARAALERGTSESKVARLTTANAIRLFRLEEAGVVPG